MCRAISRRKSETVLDCAVSEPVEKVDDCDTNLRSAVALLLLAGRTGLFGVHGVDTGLPSGDQQVADLFALAHPLVDGRRRAVLEVVGMGGDAEHGLEARLVEGGQCCQPLLVGVFRHLLTLGRRWRGVEQV